MDDNATLGEAFARTRLLGEEGFRLSPGDAKPEEAPRRRGPGVAA